MCPKHDKPLELFCKTDQTCVCMLCTVLDHKMHDVVPLKEAYEGKKAALGKKEARIQEMIQKRQLKIEEIKQSVDLSKEDADREIAEGVQVFTALKESVEKNLNEFIQTIEGKQNMRMKRAEDFIKELEQEISQLKKRGKQSLSSGKFYFEVQVKGKTEWDFGVARESINRKGDISLCPEDGYWTIWLTKGFEGLVSFYDVDAAALLYSFTGCSFNGKIYPYFSPGAKCGRKNSAPLIISPVT
ncbi:hypothetical protein JOQ06_013676 [Pogonophryne albipinna]|uniref:B box-type domain-containing protein n=1 Tax=Pogonophryne albipinna TaxID=1090488 RepID=A0AAD6FTC6_9TELE|nr:hypothetical protein JOQ06_013676 [Pogonophryne albipinna]